MQLTTLLLLLFSNAIVIVTYEISYFWNQLFIKTLSVKISVFIAVVKISFCVLEFMGTASTGVY
jgi:hypothetical protein